MKILVAGDFVPLDRVADLLEKDKFHDVFGEVGPLISESDYSIVNFESPVAIRKSAFPIEKNGPNLKCTPKAVDALRWAGFDMVTLANNHFFDYGKEGVEDTLATCKEKDIDVYIDPDDPSLETPGDMIHKVNAYLARTGQEKLESKGAFLKVIYQSMALNYRCALDRLTTLRGKNFDSLLIVGGGNQAVVLDQFAANATGLPVETGPIEATVLGNALCQMIALGEIPDKEEGRKHIRDSISVKTYLPKERALWERKYETFRRITGK